MEAQFKKGSVPENKGSGSFFFQPTHALNNPGDAHGQKADAVVEKVVQLNSFHSTMTPFFKPLTVPVQRKCSQCNDEEKQPLQRKEATTATTDANSGLEHYMNNLSGKGQPLRPEVRSFFESRMGYDFNEVKVHADAAAAASSQSINALAFTSGNHIVFNQGQFAPDTNSGKRLLGHELTMWYNNGSRHPVIR